MEVIQRFGNENKREEANSLITYGCSSLLLHLLERDVTPQQVINPVVDVSKYFRNNHTSRSNKMDYSVRMYWDMLQE